MRAVNAVLVVVVAALALMLTLAGAPVLGAEPSLDSTAAALSGYLHNNRLPLVEARLVTDSFGLRTLVLYGFVATPFGKSDAEAQSRRFLNEQDLFIDNRILVRPELLHPDTASPDTAVAGGGQGSQPPAASGPTDDESAPPADAEAGQALGDVQAYEDQEDNDLQIGAPFVAPIPLVALGVIPLAPIGPPAWNYPGVPFVAPPFFYGYRIRPYPPAPYAPAPWMATRTYNTVPITGPIGATSVFAPPLTPGRIMPMPGVPPPGYVAPSVNYAPMGGMQYFHNSFGGGGFGFVGGFHR